MRSFAASGVLASATVQRPAHQEAKGLFPAGLRGLASEPAFVDVAGLQPGAWHHASPRRRTPRGRKMEIAVRPHERRRGQLKNGNWPGTVKKCGAKTQGPYFGSSGVRASRMNG